MPDARNPREEAQRLVPGGYVARVLEPSPPAVDDGEWFADDPAAVGDPGGQRTVTPTSAGDLTWDQLATRDPAVADHAAAHWLGSWRRLRPVPDRFAAEREDVHRLAYAVLSNARKAANGRFGLRYTCGGLGTPFFGEGVQVRLEGLVVVVQRSDEVRAAPLTTIAAAGELCGVTPDEAQREHDTVELGDVTRELDVSAETVDRLADWFGFSWSVLEELRLTPGAEEVGRVQLWPGHLDPALEMGVHRQEGGTRATYGCSPGDAAHAEPYLYVGAWGGIDRAHPYWNDDGFGGASLSYRELLAADDQRETALAFFRRGYDLLHG